MLSVGQLSAWMDQDATWYLGLGPGHIVLDGDPARQRGTAPPQFSAHVCCGWPNGWMDQDATW